MASAHLSEHYKPHRAITAKISIYAKGSDCGKLLDDRQDCSRYPPGLCSDKENVLAADRRLGR